VTPWEASLEELAPLEGELRRVFALYLRPPDLPDDLTPEAIAALYPPEAQATIQAAWEAIAAQAILTAAAAQYNALDLSGSFDLANPYAAAFLAEHGAALVTEITATTRVALATALTTYATEGLSADQIARAIRPFVGLHSRQAAALLAYRAEQLAEATTARLRTAAEARIARYAARLLRERLTTIARTELVTAHARGTLDSWREADRQGLLRPGARKVWLTAPGERTCDICRPLDGVKVALNEPFPRTGALAPTLHPNCRCAMGLTYA